MKKSEAFEQLKILLKQKKTKKKNLFKIIWNVKKKFEEQHIRSKNGLEDYAVGVKCFPMILKVGVYKKYWKSNEKN